MAKKERFDAAHTSTTWKQIIVLTIRIAAALVISVIITAAIHKPSRELLLRNLYYTYQDYFDALYVFEHARFPEEGRIIPEEKERDSMDGDWERGDSFCV